MEVIKPVFFVNGEVESNEDINTVFTLPQRLKFISDNMKSILLEDVKLASSDPDFYQKWSLRYIGDQIRVKYNTMASYIFMNATELFRMNILTFLQHRFDKYFKNKLDLYNFQSTISKFNSSQYINLILNSYEQRLQNIIDQESLTYPEKKKFVFLSLEQVSDIMCNEITILYTEFINNKIHDLILSNVFHKFYEDMYKEIYNEKAFTYNIDYVYTFLSTILHSEVEEEIKKIRNALSMVMANASQMFLDLSYGDQVSLKDYSHQNYLDDMSDVEFIEGGDIYE